MVLQFYNSLTNKKEEFKPIEEGKVKMYSCGPTVYDFVHIGNLRCYVFNDILRRYLKYKGYELYQVMNITDVDDKTIKNAQKAETSLSLLTAKFTKAFLDDLKTLNIDYPEKLAPATEHIEEMVKLIQDLQKSRFTYEKNGSIYFRINNFSDYGVLANLDTTSMMQNAEGRLNDDDEYEKDNVRDFVLWKAYKEDDGKVFWENELGKGRPGWHIECSAMSMKYLGKSFDIHTGGIDLLFPHHTNEIAQSEGASGRKFVNYWLHNAHLIVNGEKMSKSLGNFYTLRDLLKKGYHPQAIRYVLLSAHYRQQLNFTEDMLEQIPSTLGKIHDFLDRLEEVKGGEDNPEVEKIIANAKDKFEKAMDDDLNISEGLSAVFGLTHDANRLKAENKLSSQDAQRVSAAMYSFDKVLGIMEHDKGSLAEDIQSLVDQREKHRAEKNFIEADKIRDKLKFMGIVLEDTPDGVRWRKAT